MGKSSKASHKSPNVSQSAADKTDSKTFLIVLFYCLLIIFSPIVAFFGCKLFIFDDWVTPVKANIYSAVVAVVSLHVALGLYLFRASFSDASATQSPSHKVVQKED